MPGPAAIRPNPSSSRIFDVAAQVDMHAQLSCKNKIKDASFEQQRIRMALYARTRVLWRKGFYLKALERVEALSGARLLLPISARFLSGISIAACFPWPITTVS
jgi:hypothetical protein